MKKQILLVLLVFSSVVTLMGQAQRRVLVEEATNASCGPCAGQNPAFDALLDQNADKVAVVKYHASWPGTDPMYLHNTVENSTRISYYGITGVPHALVEGTISTSPSSVTQSMINQRYAVSSPFHEIEIYHHLSPNQDSIYVYARIRGAQDFEGDNMKAHLVVLEKHIHFNSAPGSNGEKDFYDVLKKMLPSKSGSLLPETWENDDYIILMNSWKLENVYDNDQLDVVAFIQDNDTKEVHQSGVGSVEPFDALFANDVAALEISNLTETLCMGYMMPEVSIANFGSEALTNLTIEYSVNGEDVQTYEWSGNLEFLETQQVMLPRVDFSVLDQNELLITLVSPNGSTDGYTKNNSASYSFESSLVTPNEVSVLIKLDNAPEEITWEVTDYNGDVVYSGGPYTEAGVVVQETMLYEESGCFEFSIHDAGGNGIAAPGFFALFYGSGTQILTGTSFGAESSGQYSVDASVGFVDHFAESKVLIYPNPVSYAAAVELTLAQESFVEVLLSNQLGQVVRNVKKEQLNAGQHSFGFDVADLRQGVYFLNISIDGRVETHKLSVVK